MKILIICTYFPPDTEIGAVKPYMIAKYLAKFGHEVTVIRLGIIKEMADNSYGDYRKGMEVLTAQGEDSDVARYERGEPIRKIDNSLAKRMPRLDLFLRFILQPLIVYRRKKMKDHLFSLQKRVIDNLKAQGRTFDIVYSTCFSFENIFSGEYAAKLFDAKWIMEFRDPIRDTKVIEYPGFEVIQKIYATRVQKHAVETCDLCTCVSQGLIDDFKKVSPNVDIKLMYNGYDDTTQDIVSFPGEANKEASKNELTLCYTGTLWRESARALGDFLECLSEFLKTSNVNRNNLKFHYAGKDSEVAKSVFQKYGLSDILVDHGYVTRNEADIMQRKSDVYLVLAWNTKNVKGCLSGKFCEGVRAKKPILSIVWGSIPNSELYDLNEKYNYGFCYESSQRDVLQPKLEDFLLKIYKEKIEKGKVEYKVNEKMIEAFNYKYIAKRFEKWCLELLEGK